MPYFIWMKFVDICILLLVIVTWIFPVEIGRGQRCQRTHQFYCIWQKKKYPRLSFSLELRENALRWVWFTSTAFQQSSWNQFGCCVCVSRPPNRCISIMWSFLPLPQCISCFFFNVCAWRVRFHLLLYYHLSLQFSIVCTIYSLVVACACSFVCPWILLCSLWCMRIMCWLSLLQHIILFENCQVRAQYLPLDCGAAAATNNNNRQSYCKQYDHHHWTKQKRKTNNKSNA